MGVEEKCVGSCALHVLLADGSHVIMLLACEAGWRLTECAKTPVNTGEAEAWGSNGSPTHTCNWAGTTSLEDNDNLGIPDAANSRAGSDTGGSLGQKTLGFERYRLQFNKYIESCRVRALSVTRL
jgi:hypothetical protein